MSPKYCSFAEGLIEYIGMLVKTKAIILHHIKYSESSILISSYTENYGRLSFMVKGARSSRSRFPMHCFQPLSQVDLDIYYKPCREVHTLRELSFPDHYLSIPFDTTKSCIAIFLADVLYRTLQEEESNPVLFDFLRSSFTLLDHTESGIANFHLAFLLHFSRYLGIYPSGLAEAEPGIIHEPDLQSLYDMSEEAVRLVILLLRQPLAETGTIQMNGRMRSLILDRIIKHFNLHLEGAVRIKSHLILKEVFNDCQEGSRKTNYNHIS